MTGQAPCQRIKSSWGVRYQIQTQNKLGHESEFLTRSNTITTNKASVLNARNTNSLRKASDLFAGASADKYEGWFLVFDDFIASGVRSVEAYSKALAVNPNITTVLPPAQTEKVLNAIRNCVKKYGTIANVKKAHAKWAKENGYHYVDISNLKKFAPAGQRAKNNDNKKVAPASAVTLTRAEGVKRLVAGGVSRKDANNYATLLGLK